MSIGYLGSKTDLLEFIIAPILADSSIQVVADAFCGTASVSIRLAQEGKTLLANDHLTMCTTLAEAELLAPSPTFEGLSHLVQETQDDLRYTSVIRLLNELPPQKGFFYRTYSPASGTTGTARMYFTEENASRIDAVRSQIERWTPFLSTRERALLLRDLLRAVSRVSNTAGTYGCYLKAWKPSALDRLWLRPQLWNDAHSTTHQVHCSDAADFVSRVEPDALYLDPPYTKRQYAAYYHILETLVKGDTPTVYGSTGLPDWQAYQSDFCYKRKASSALDRLIHVAKCPNIFLSYSNEGHIPHSQIIDILSERGKVTWWELPKRRYRSNGKQPPTNSVIERLYHLSLG